MWDLWLNRLANLVNGCLSFYFIYFCLTQEYFTNKTTGREEIFLPFKQVLQMILTHTQNDSWQGI